MIILIAVNSAIIRGRILEHLLRVRKIARVMQAASVQETIDACLQFHPNVIILDHHLPGGNVMDVLKALHPDNSDALAIILTDSESQSVREQFLANGASYVLDQRIALDKIIEIIKPTNS